MQPIISSQGFTLEDAVDAAIASDMYRRAGLLGTSPYGNGSGVAKSRDAYDYNFTAHKSDAWMSRPDIAVYDREDVGAFGSEFDADRLDEDSRIPDRFLARSNALVADPCGFFAERFRRSFGYGPKRLLAIQHLSFRQLDLLNRCEDFDGFDRLLRRMIHESRICSLHGTSFITASDPVKLNDEARFPPYIYDKDEDDAMGAEMWGISPDNGKDATFEIDPLMASISDEDISRALDVNAKNLAKCTGQADEDTTVGGLPRIRPGSAMEMANALFLPSVPLAPQVCTYRGECEGDYLPEYFDITTFHVVGIWGLNTPAWPEPKRRALVDEASIYAELYDKVRYPGGRHVAAPDVTLVRITRQAAVPSSDCRADFAASVPGTYDEPFSRAAYMAFVSDVRVDWKKFASALPKRWEVFLRPTSCDDRRIRSLMLWGRQAEFQGAMDWPNLSRDQPQCLIDNKMNALFRGFVRMALGDIPSPSPLLVTGALIGSRFFYRLARSGIGWFLPPMKSRPSPLVVRLIDTDLFIKRQNIPSEDFGWIWTPFDHEPSVAIMLGSHIPWIPEKREARFSEIQCMFYAALMIATRSCDLPYFFNWDGVGGDHRIVSGMRQGVPESVYEVQAYYTPELRVPSNIFDTFLGNGTREAIWSAMDICAFMGQSVSPRCVNCPRGVENFEVYPGSSCPRIRVSDVVRFESPDNVVSRQDFVEQGDRPVW
jgi:hypothetical protein